MRTITLYVDVISPYSWLAAVQAPTILARAGARLVMQPVVFGKLLDNAGTLGPAEIPVKRVFVFTEALRWAKFLGRPCEGPPAHPFNPLRALRLALTVPEGEPRNRLLIELLMAPWERGEDLTRDATLAAIARRGGHDGDALVARIDEPAIKAGLKETTEAAIAAGAFGVPTFIVDDGALFFGCDRFPHLEAYLAGNLTIDEKKLATALARPRAIDRKRPGI